MNKKTIVIASDSFKGTLSSLDICNLFKNEVASYDVNAIYLPIADGGEGSLEAISNIVKGHNQEIEVSDLYFNSIKTRFYIDNNNNAYIETTSSAGLNLAKENNDPGLTTTYGLGEQIKKAIELGCKNIYIFLGGSATNDGGVGLASALGTKFYDKNNNEFIPTGLTLKNINHIDNKETLDTIKNVNIFALVDVKSPLCGLEGASYKFGPQKGASEEEVKLLDEGMSHLASIIKKDLEIDVLDIPGAGAAGGLGGGLYAFLNAAVSSGINTVLDLINFDDIIKNADLVISGEGKFDKQTYDGKVIDGIARRCIRHDKPLDIIIGITSVGYDEIRSIYPCIRNIYETNEEHLPFEEVKKMAKESCIKKIKELLNNL